MNLLKLINDVKEMDLPESVKKELVELLTSVNEYLLAQTDLASDNKKALELLNEQQETIKNLREIISNTHIILSSHADALKGLKGLEEVMQALHTIRKAKS